MFINVNLKKAGRIGISALVLLVAAAGAWGSYKLISGEEASHASSENWGLSFQEEGKVPIGNKSMEELAKYNGFFCGDPKSKQIYLTFDAGYENGYTEKILDVLKKKKVMATFFVVGDYIEKNPDLIKRMVKDGHIVGNHTMRHLDMSAISDKATFKDELEGVEVMYKQVVGKDMLKIYRPPQGKFSMDNLKMASEMGYMTIFWSLAYVDWYVDKQPEEEEAFEKLIPRMHNGAIILLHSTSKTNAKILEKLITNWENEGYKFASLQNLGSL